MENETPNSPNDDLKILNVRDRLQELSQWSEEWISEDSKLEKELFHLSDNPHDVQRGKQIVQLRKAALYRLIKEPIYLDNEAIANYGIDKYREQLVSQYATLSREEKKLWLNNLLFISTPNLKKLDDKINYLLNFKSFGQGRNLLLSGLSGTGKSTFLFWRVSKEKPVILDDHNEVPIIIVQCTVNNRSTKYLFQRIINGTGKSFGLLTIRNNPAFY